MATRITFQPRPKFKPAITRARVGTPGFSADAMARFGNILNNDVIARFDRAQDIYDGAAPPLSARYAAYKQKRTGAPIRNIFLTGRTRRGMRLLSAQQNKAVIGFSDPVAEQRMRFNNIRSRMYGASPRNLDALYKAVSESLERPVTIEVKSA